MNCARPGLSSDALQFSPVHQSRTGEWGSVGTPLAGQHWLASCLPTVLGPKQLQPRLLFRISKSSWTRARRIQRPLWHKEPTATHEAPMASRELPKARRVALGQVGLGPLRLLDARVCVDVGARVDVHGLLRAGVAVVNGREEQGEAELRTSQRCAAGQSTAASCEICETCKEKVPHAREIWSR